MTATVTYECDTCEEKFTSPDKLRVLEGGGLICEPCNERTWNTDHEWAVAMRPPIHYLAEENPEEQADRMDALARALIEVTKAYRAERDSLYDGCTLKDGTFDHPDDKAACTEMDAIIARATAALAAEGLSLDDEIIEETVQ